MFPPEVHLVNNTILKLQKIIGCVCLLLAIVEWRLETCFSIFCLLTCCKTADEYIFSHARQREKFLGGPNGQLVMEW